MDRVSESQEELMALLDSGLNGTQELGMDFSALIFILSFLCFFFGIIFG
jgi:hypothetical protein